MTHTAQQTVQVLRGITEWKFGLNLRDYKLPSGDYCSDYLVETLYNLMKHIGVYLTKEGHLTAGWFQSCDNTFRGGWVNEFLTDKEMHTRVWQFVHENCFKSN